ncbi:helicase-related protein [Citrobacter cronae]|uniref:Helicase n=1 Tax=Citrobacter cronae TaxID=1748967 RepID=A0A7X1EJS2_9ENTR|nr:helicase-related protein [Citrobacter cronae]MBC2622681.1 helicase [Citrobacter cronae]
MPDGKYAEILDSFRTVEEIIRLIRSLGLTREPVIYGITKKDGVSVDRERKEANRKAIELLNSLPDGAELTPEQRQTLARYTGEGGIGGSTDEYYTPQFVAEGIWEIMKLYGADAGNTLEPSSGAGVFNETKPRGTVMTATEISPISGRINQLLHPEDAVHVMPFEKLASGTDDAIFDHCVGNVPFGSTRGDTMNLDKAYAKEKDIGRYFILRLLDKIKPGGLACIIVPYGMTSGTRMKKLREQVSRKAEFLGAHRLPSGTFKENGTPTAVDVWVLRKHPESLSNMILQAKEELLVEANVLWPEFITGKWFEHDGKRFVYGEVSTGFQGRIVIKNDQITPSALKEKLARRFDSRINWDLLSVPEPVNQSAKEGDKRLMNGQWYEFINGQWVISVPTSTLKVDPAIYGVSSLDEIKVVLDNPSALLARDWKQVQALAGNYWESMSESTRKAYSYALTQRGDLQERLFRGALIGAQIGVLQDAIANKMPGDYIDSLRTSAAQLVDEEYKRFGDPNTGKISKISGNNSGDWLKYRAAITSTGELSDLLQGSIEAQVSGEYDTTNHEQVVRSLFNQIDLIPITLAEFRATSTAELPESDEELLDLLANTDGIAITPTGDLMPMDRATSGDIGLITGQIQGVLAIIKEGPQKNNYLRQLEEIKSKRKWTGVDDIAFTLDARWFDRSLVLEFLRENGYDELTYVDSIKIENGALVSELGYRGNNGVFAGYRYGTVLKKDKDTGENVPTYARRTSSDPFAAQLEKYLNGGRATGVNTEAYRSRIEDLESRFNDWIRQHDEIDKLVDQYNAAFNSFIPFEQSDSPLGLKGISGRRAPFGYQNQEIRRLSEDGRGIMGFGTGLGKTTTALALGLYNIENGRSTRQAYVVPKAVYENWYYEAKSFYSEEMFNKILFVGLDTIPDDAGGIRQVQVRGENGEPKFDDNGVPVMRDALKISDSATIKARMNMIPQSNYPIVVMTKEQYAAIPMREETIRDHAHDVLFAQAEAGRVKILAETYKEQQKKNRLLSEHSDTGTEKQHDFPYFEDMQFDSVIVDEGHNYRNSYSAGREASQLAYLPVPSVSQSARDMAVKNAYLMAKNNGRGPVLLTATPVVNSPIDAFNMLSHCLSMSDWQRMGIYTPDDFVKVFGKKEMCLVQKLSGQVESKLGLVGFRNLPGLRGIFHRWVSLKTAQDVSEQVKIPELDERTVEAPMSEEQEIEYENLRQRAEKLSQNDKMGDFDSEPEDADEEKDTIFGIIRDMDRVCTDMDLYRHQITFLLPAADVDKVQQLVADLPDSLGAKEESDEDYDAEGRFTVDVDGNTCTLVVPEMYEQEVIKRLSTFDIDPKEVSHPLTPKYSALIEGLKEGLKNGKQIIFTDEKSQHGKLKRIICSHLGLDDSAVGILNATTVAEAGKKGRKPKKVKQPKDLPDEPTEEQVKAYYEQKAAYDEYVAAINEVSLGGLEQIAADYNEGRSRILICNKKAEVGINLHIGTTDIHHLTLPWTPASIDQRNGRGARVGSTQDSVKVHYYCGRGSFDEFRLQTLKRKKDWIREILTSDKAEMENADAGNMVEMQLLLAANPEERERRIAEQVAKAKAAVLERATKRANLDLQNYIKAQHASGSDLEKEQQRIAYLEGEVERTSKHLELVRNEIEELLSEREAIKEREVAGTPKSNDSWRPRGIERELRIMREQLNVASKADVSARSALMKQQRKISRLAKAEQNIKQLRPVVLKAIKEGLLKVDPDVIDHGKEILLVEGKTYKVGQYFHFNTATRGGKYDSISYAKIVGLDFDARTANLRGIFSANGTSSAPDAKNVPVQLLGDPCDVTKSELEVLSELQGGLSIRKAAELLSKDQFYTFLKTGQLVLTDNYSVAYDGGEYTQQTLNIRSAGYGYGSSDTKSIAWYQQNGHKLVYPDRSDEQLKRAIAIQERQQARFTNSCQGFLLALYGENYKTVMAGFGEVASADEIAALVAKKVASFSLWSSSRDFNISVNEYIRSGLVRSVELDRLAWLSNEVPAIYTNKQDFISALEAEKPRLRKQAQQELITGVASVAQERYEEFSRAIKSGYAPGDREIQSVLDGSGTFLNIYGGNGQDYFRVVEACAAMVIIGLLDPSKVTAELLVHEDDARQLVRDADKLYYNMSEEDKKRVSDTYQAKRLGVSTEEYQKREDARKEEKRNTENEADELGLRIQVNTTRLRGKYGLNFAPGGCYGLQDPRGKEGALFRAKEELKADFGARYYNGRDAGEEFAGSWWLIPIKYGQAEILKVVAKY